MTSPPNYNYESSRYIPAPYLYNDSVLTAPQLISHFQDFYVNLEHISCTPSLVFERLVANLNGTFTAALKQERVQHAAALEQERLKHSITLERERLEHAAALERERLEHTTTLEKTHIQHAAALEKCLDENKTLQSFNERLRAELVELKETISDSASKTTSSPTVGTFYIHEVRKPAAPCAKTSKTISFAKDYSAPPHLSIGLNMLDISNSDNVRVKAFSSDVQKDHFNINIQTWGNTVVHDGGCTWLEIDANDPGLQFGAYCTGEDYPWTDPRTHHTRVVTFPRAYSVPPNVVVWLSLLDMSKHFNWRVKTYTTDITTTGFTLHIHSWSDSVLYYASTEWIAYPVGKPNIFSGTFSTSDVRPPNNPQLYNSGYVNFGSCFPAPPRILLAINSLDIGHRQNLRLTAKASNISAAGMTWHLDSWSDTILYSAGASYVALG